MQSGSLSTLSIPKWRGRCRLSSAGSSASIGDMRSSISNHLSTTKIAAQLTRCSSSVPSSKGWSKLKKKDTPPTDLAKVLDKYHAEEDQYLIEFERMQRSIMTPDYSSTGSISIDGLLTDDQISSSALDPPINQSASSKNLAPPSLFNKRRGSSARPPPCPSPQTDLLGSFCHLMNYVVHLRRDNRQLRRQVSCLTEMRKIDELKNDLLGASCHCKTDQLDNKDDEHNLTHIKQNCKLNSLDKLRSTAGRAEDVGEQKNKKLDSASTKTNDIEGLMNGRGGVPSAATDGSLSPGRTGSNFFSRILDGRNSVGGQNRRFGSTPNIITATMNSAERTRSAFSSRLHKAKQQKNAVIREGVAEALATPPPSAGLQAPSSPKQFRNPIFSLPDLRDVDATRPGPSRRHMPLPPLPAGGTSDSDDQPVFAEVSLPTLADGGRRSASRRSSNMPSPTPTYPKLLLPHDEMDNKCARDRVAPTSPMSERSTTSVNSNRSSLLDKIGKIGWRRKDQHDQSNAESSRKVMCNSLTVPSSDGSESMYYGLYSKKAIVKKRKRKISESDSMASSERSGKPYKTIDFPVEAAAAGNRSTCTVDIDALQRQLSPEYAKKMSEWNEKRPVSCKGQASKKSWLRKPKQIKIEQPQQTPEHNNSRPYFQLSLDQEDSHSSGRQNTVIYNEPTSPCSLVTPSIAISYANTSHSASDSNISQIEANSPTSVSPSPRNSKLSLPTANAAMTDKICNSRSGHLLTIADDLSLGGSIISEDSVFGSQEFLPGLDEGQGLLGTLLSMQDKNSRLIHQLRDKSHECDSITDQMQQLEKQFSVLKGRFRMETNIKKIIAEKTTPLKLVPLSLLDDLEAKLKSMDEEIKSAKTSAFKAQQDALEAHSKEQSSNQTYLDNIERLQKTNFQILQRDMTELSLYDGEIQKRLEIMPTYDSLYSFAMNLIRKLRQLRSSVLERVAGASRLDLEMLQTQSSLLLAHAQIERQKIELKNLGDKKQNCKRPNSYHGDDLATRLIKPELSFYLPFKLQGSRHCKYSSTEALKEAIINENRLEDDFIKLFVSALTMNQPTQNDNIPVKDFGASIHYQPYHSNSNSSDQLMESRTSMYSPVPPRFVSKVRGMGSPLASIKQNEALKSVQTPPPLVQMRNNSKASSHETKRPLSFAESVSQSTGWKPLNRQRQMLSMDALHYHDNTHCEHIVAFTSVSADLSSGTPNNFVCNNNPDQGSQDWNRNPSYQTKAPEPLHLGNNGQVKAIAAAFDGSTTSAPTTPQSKVAPHIVMPTSKPNSPLPPPRRTLMTPRQINHTTSPVPERHYDTPANSCLSPRSSDAQQREKMEMDLNSKAGASRLVKQGNLSTKVNVCKPYAYAKIPTQRSMDSSNTPQTAGNFGHYLSPPSQLIRPTGLVSPLATKRPSPTSSMHSSNHYESLSLTSQKAPSSAIPNVKYSPAPAKPRIYVPRNLKSVENMDKSSTPESLTTSSSSGGGKLRKLVPGSRDSASLGIALRKGAVSPPQKDSQCPRIARSQLIQSPTPRIRMKNPTEISNLQKPEPMKQSVEEKSKRSSWIMRFKPNSKK